MTSIFETHHDPRPVGKGDEGASDEFYYGDDEELTADASDDIGADETTVSTAEYADPSPAAKRYPRQTARRSRLPKPRRRRNPSRRSSQKNTFFPKKNSAVSTKITKL